MFYDLVMSLEKIAIVVIGSMNTDIVGFVDEKIVKEGGHTHGKELKIGPGGKSRNMAQMISVFTGAGKVGMIGVSCKDPYNLWKLPIDSLRQSGVNTDYVKVFDFEEKKKLPGVAIILVDSKGNNQIYAIPGISNELSKDHIDSADPLFEAAKKNNGFLVLSLEMPFDSAIYAIKKANEFGLRIMLDPGGISENKDYSNVFDEKIFLIKPNEHEARLLTGIEVVDFDSAKKAAKVFIEKGVENVFITVGKMGAFFFNKDVEKHISIPDIKLDSVNDETGCGDQTMAALCACLVSGYDILDSIELAVVAGTLQFYKQGIQPVTRQELEKHGKILK